MMDIEHFLYLLGRYEQDVATEVEEATFLAFFGDPGNRDEIKDLFVRMLNNTPLGKVPDPARWQPVINRILDSEEKNTEQAYPKRGLLTDLRRHKWWAAAAIILCIGSGSYFFFFNKPKSGIAKTETRSPYKNDIPPGGNKAILTLSGGRRVVLDSAANGILTQQGNTNIIKIDSGKLAYSPGSGQKEVVYNILTTPRGGQYQLTLPDGTNVWLNAASSIRYPTAFAGNERKVEITGEAYFEVKHNSGMPFRVKIKDLVIEDLGTRFNVMAYDEEQVIKTTLLDGSVKILSTVNRQLSTTLLPGQQAQLSPSGTITLDKNVDMEQVMAWKNGLFNFKSQDIDAIMRQISRWYDVEIIYSGEKPQGHFSGMVDRNTNVSTVLKMLELSNINFRIDDRKITVLP
jgi:hypothetical protein